MITPQELAAQFPQFAQQQPAQAFTWGAGGQRLTPEQLASQQAVAAELMKSNYSPVQNVWQGLGRVTDNILGAIDSRKLDKEQASNNAYSDSIAQALLADPSGAGAAMADPYASAAVRQLAAKQFDVANRKPAEPHYFESNNGSQFRVGPNGLPEEIYHDPTPKIDWIQSRDPNTGQVTLYPMQQGGGGQASMSGGGASPSSSIPMGSPLQGAPNSKTIQGPNGPMQVWQVNGEWYDNPEGR